MSKQKKRVCVVGLGQFGRELAVGLARDCEVVAIDRSQAAVNAIADSVHRALCLDARDAASLQSAVSGDFDEAVVCMSESIESSILCVLHLKKIGARKIHAKAKNDDHARILEALECDNIVFPERETAQRLAKHIVHPNVLDSIPLAEEYSVTQVSPPEEFCGRTLRELDLRRQYGVFIIAIREVLEGRMVFLPPAEFVVKNSDVLVAIAKTEGMAALQAGKPLGGAAKPPGE